jgi:enoyl-CoA hydratase/carnithine racemase
MSAPTYETVLFEVVDHVATITLNRPDKLNSFNQPMVDEFRDVWERVRTDDDIHVAVLRAAGERAFCTGVDVSEGIDLAENVWSQVDPGDGLSPRANKVWKPVIAAVHGMVAGGAFYWLNDVDIIIGADDATFFDPHVSYGMTSALEPIGLARRIPLGEVMRWALIGLDERMSAARAPTAGAHHRGQAAGRGAGHREGRVGDARPGPRDRTGGRVQLHDGRQPDRHRAGLAVRFHEAGVDPALILISRASTSGASSMT